jgi:hypothetical protein
MIVSCSKSGKLDLESADIRFMNPSSQVHINTSSYNFQFQMISNSQLIDAARSRMNLNLYEDASCDSSKWLVSLPVTVDGANGSITPSSGMLVDGKTYSIDVSIGNFYESKCSAPVTIDLQAPAALSFTFPTSYTIATQTQSLFSWTAGMDNGVSGLAATPYHVQLFSQAACGGSAVTTVETTDPQYTFTDLTQGTIYSVQISSFDKAGNQSATTCSSGTEVDTEIPGFQLSDSTSTPGYSRVLTSDVTITNDPTAAAWCFTTNTSFIPTACTDACPGGGGSSNGWYTSAPSTLTLAAGDGLKTYNLWICDSGGNLITHNVSTGAITLDQTLPGSFTVTGIGGGIDIYFDAYWTASVQPEVKWTTSTDAVNYTIQIVDGSNTVLCSQSELTVTDYTFTNCPALTDGQTYKVKITSYDTALNSTSAPDFTFTVDRMPPGSFSITGVTGGADVTADHWLGTSNPAVNYGSASNSTHYQIQVKDAGGGVVCTLGTKSDQTGLFDYNSEGGVSCFGLIDGLSYKAYVSAFDDGENETQASNNGYDFTVDTDPPALSLGSVPAFTDDSFITVSFTASDLASGMDVTECRIDGGAYAACSGSVSYIGLSSGTHQVDVKAMDLAGNSTIQSVTWNRYGYSWIASGFSGCTATQPTWQAGGWGSCSVAQPAYQYGGWGSCSVTCGGGTQTRTQTCPVVTGTQTQTVTCPVNTGTETQTVQCQRTDGAIVADTFCDAGTKPPTSEACTRGGGTDCFGTKPATSQSCSRGGGSDCSGAQSTVQSCNTQACTTWHLETPTWDPGVYCMGITNGASCSTPGFYCGAIDIGMIAHCY